MNGIGGDMETLAEKQQRFARMVVQLLTQAHAMGYEVTLGDAYRDPQLHGAFGVKAGYGAPKSCHKLKLAIDLNLFLGGKYLDKTEDHQALGEWWERQGGSWGGRFNDGNHYSLEHNGAK